MKTKKKTRLTAIITAVIMVVALMPVMHVQTAHASSFYAVVDHIEYRFESDGTAVVTGLEENVSVTTVTIPETVVADESYDSSTPRTYTVTGIGQEAFYECGMSSITLPDTLQRKKSSAFSYCENLKTISIPANVTNIEDSAFYYAGISKVSFASKSKLESIGAYAFGGCENLKSISLPDSVTSIGKGAFAACTSLENVPLPSNISTISERMFEQCSSLETITIPANVTSIGSEAFWESGIKRVSVGSGSKLENIGGSAFYNCSRFESITLPVSLKNIAYSAFECSGSSPSGSIITIYYLGTEEQWSQVGKEFGWAWGTDVNVIYEAGASEFSGTGSKTQPYVIKGSFGWDIFAGLVADGDNMEGKYVQLDADIYVSQSVGTSGTRFAGTFDGNKHIITFNETTQGQYCAPFAYANNATFLNLHTKGTITTDGKFAAGLVSDTTGNITVKNCKSSMAIISNVNGDGTHGGFIAKTGGTVTFEGCVFDGKIIGPNTTLSSGFLGYDPNHTSKGINCVFDAAEIDTLSTTSTFIRATDQDINSYYTWAIGQGRDYGKQARSVTAGKGVTLGFGTGTAYDVSGIVAHRTGLEYNDVFYAGKDETVSLVMADPSANGYYIADAGTFSGSGKNYQLVMPDGDVVISMVYTKLPAPKDVRIEKYTSENGYLNSDDALIGKWSATNGAAGYYVTPYQIKNGTAEALCDPVDVGNTLSYNLTGDFAWRNAQGNGIFTFGVQAYGNGDVKPSSVAKASEPVEFYDIILEYGNSGSDLNVLVGSNIGDAVSDVYKSSYAYDYYISNGDYYTRTHSGTDVKIIAFTPKSLHNYKTFQEMREDAYLIPGEPAKEVRLTGVTRVYAIGEESICAQTGDLHNWEKIVTKGSIGDGKENWGECHYVCEDCHMEDEGYYISPVLGFEMEKTSYTFTGKPLKPAVKIITPYSDTWEVLKEGTDFNITYKNNLNVGTATAQIELIGDREGTATVAFEITPASISTAKISGIADQTYTGKAITPAPVVKLGDVTLKAGTDYDVSYANNTAIGTAKVIVKGKGNLTGTAEKSFKIVKAAAPKDDDTIQKEKAANPMKLKAKKITVKRKTLKKKKVTLKVSKVIKFSKKGKGKMSYKIKSAKKGKKNFKKYFKINAKTGKVTIKKGLKKGTYKVKIKVKASGNADYKAKTKTVTVTVKVR